MKNLILLLMVTIISATCVFAADDTNVRKQAFRAMARSHQYQHETCMNIARNFRFDNRFANYLRGKCLIYESDRQRLLETIFPLTNSELDGYKDQYPVLMSQFAITMNNREVEEYKIIVTEYCKHNMFKVNKKDPQACSQARINSLF